MGFYKEPVFVCLFYSHRQRGRRLIMLYCRKGRQPAAFRTEAAEGYFTWTSEVYA